MIMMMGCSMGWVGGWVWMRGGRQSVVVGPWRRFVLHMVSAASGNTASSLVFVPKEVIKQQLQVRGREDLTHSWLLPVRPLTPP